MNLKKLLMQLEEDKQTLKTEKETFESQITTGFRIVAELFERLLNQAVQALEHRHKEANVNFMTFQTSIV